MKKEKEEKPNSPPSPKETVPPVRKGLNICIPSINNG